MILDVNDFRKNDSFQVFGCISKNALKNILIILEFQGILVILLVP
jgi:hypothetical protein